jgi:hypothetical protein
MKNQGYNLEYNYGHGISTLASVFVGLCFIAFNLHSLAILVDNELISAKKNYFTE